jgi:hypothetical protein
MARQAEAERERRAKIINSEGEFQAAQKLTDAADIISTNPASLQLRYLQTLLEIGSNQNTTVVFPLPMDVLEPFVRGAAGNGAKPKPPRPPQAPTPPHGGEPVPGVEGSGLPTEADAAPAPGGGGRPAPGVLAPEDAPAGDDLPPSRS